MELSKEVKNIFPNVKYFFYATTHESKNFCAFMKDIKFNDIKKFDNLADILADKIYSFNNVDLIIPVPKFKDEQNETDFSLRIAKIIFEKNNIPYSTDVIVKTKKTKKLKVIPIEQREKEINNAFAVKNSNILTNKKICIVDDVLSSGNTIKEIVKTILEQSKVKDISVAIAVVENSIK